MLGPILFFHTSPRNANVAVRLAQRGHPIVTNTPELAGALTRAGVASHAFDSFRDSESADGGSEASELLDEWRATLADPVALAAFETPSGRLSSRLGRAALEVLENELPAILDNARAYDAMCRELGPALSVFGTLSTAPQRAAAQAAQRLGHPCLELAHGVHGPGPVHIAGEYQPLQAAYAAFGERARRALVELGNDPSQLYVTGCPWWDDLFGTGTPTLGAAAKSALGLDPNKKTVLFVAGYSDPRWAHFATIARRLAQTQRALFDAVAGLGDDVQVLVRNHPSEVGALPAEERERLCGEYLDWCRGDSNLDLRLDDGSLYDAIRAADAVVTVPSTVVIEAMILGRPVVMPRRFPSADRFFTAEDGVLVVDELEELAPALEAALQDESVRARCLEQQAYALPDLHHANDGRAADRVAALIEVLADGVPDGSVVEEAVS